MTILHSIKTVLWSFIGLGGGDRRQAANERVNPLVLIAIAFVLVLLFLASLALVARQVAGAG